jgi:hypothetical protein
VSTVYFVDRAEPAEFGIGTTYRVQAESTTPGCSHWYRAFLSRRGALDVTRLDDATGTYQPRGLDGDAYVFPDDDPITRHVAEAVERHQEESAKRS